MPAPKNNQNNDELNDLLGEAIRATKDCNGSICIGEVFKNAETIKNGGLIDSKSLNELIAEANKNFVWYPDDGICTCYRKKSVQKLLNLDNGTAPKWIRRQFNIKKKSKKREYFFTFEMLSTETRKVGYGTKGLSADHDLDKQLERFFKNGGNDNEKRI
jgi:hypothetical protein